MSRLVTKDDVQIYKGKYYLPWFKKDEVIHFSTPKKVVVLDLDETLGSFADLYIIWCGIQHAWPSCNYFEELLEAYPEFLRYGILTILEYLYQKKRKKECYKLFIYTNNQCSSSWVHMITNYLEKKVIPLEKRHKHKLFDKIICAFKINNKTIEPGRTGHSKKIDDFLRCSLVSESADICFIDDAHYPAMKGAKVYYICPRPYVHALSTQTIITRLLSLKWMKRGLLTTKHFWKDWFYINNKKYVRHGKSDIEMDLQISQKIIYHLQEFMMFGMSKQIDSMKRKTKRVTSRQTLRKTKKIMRIH